MGISVEIREFAEIMTNRMRSFDEKLGTNNHIHHMTIENVRDCLLSDAQQLQYEDPVNAKGLCVDIANLAMILWKKL